LMHEYLHNLANKKYHDYADKLGGESSTEGNTLIEGVDSLLSEIAWSSAVQNAGKLTVRSIVEPDAAAAGPPSATAPLPTMPAGDRPLVGEYDFAAAPLHPPSLDDVEIHRLDIHWGAALLKGGEAVIPALGLSLIRVNSNMVVGCRAFSPMTLENYVATRRPP